MKNDITAAGELISDSDLRASGTLKISDIFSRIPLPFRAISGGGSQELEVTNSRYAGDFFEIDINYVGGDMCTTLVFGDPALREVDGQGIQLYDQKEGIDSNGIFIAFSTVGR